MAIRSARAIGQPFQADFIVAGQDFVAVLREIPNSGHNPAFSAAPCLDSSQDGAVLYWTYRAITRMANVGEREGRCAAFATAVLGLSASNESRFLTMHTRSHIRPSALGETSKQ